MNALGKWLQDELEARDLTLQAASTYSGVGIGTMSDIIRKGHTPRLETLFRLADYFGTSRERVLRLAARMPPQPAGRGEEEDFLVAELLDEFRQVPDEWKELVLEQVAWLRRLAERPPARIIGGEEEEGEAEQQARSAAA